jgi:hypothetical protein
VRTYVRACRLHPPVRPRPCRGGSQRLRDRPPPRHPAHTVRDWRRRPYAAEHRGTCWRRWRPARPTLFASADYAELLGLYLGDGYVCALPRTERLRIFLDARYATVVAEAEPWALLRGLIRSDGCVFVNRTGKYRYLSYCFDNLSTDIRELFVATCRLVGVDCRTSGRSVRVYRRASVVLMLEHVGVKT